MYITIYNILFTLYIIQIYTLIFLPERKTKNNPHLFIPYSIIPRCLSLSCSVNHRLSTLYAHSPAVSSSSSFPSLFSSATQHPSIPGQTLYHPGLWISSLPTFRIFPIRAGYFLTVFSFVPWIQNLNLKNNCVPCFGLK